MNDWFPTTELLTSWEQFRTLPRHPAFRYEYRNQQTRITGRPRYIHAVLQLDRLPAPQKSDLNFESIEQNQIDSLQPLFVSAFQQTAPISLQSREQALIAAKEFLERTQSGNDGPLIPEASLIARSHETILGAIVVTQIPSIRFGDFTDPEWQQASPPPEETSGSQRGYPHLTWIFIDASAQRRGIGRQLLLNAGQALRERGDSLLASTFLMGNEASLLWHWRNGFELTDHPLSSQISQT